MGILGRLARNYVPSLNMTVVSLEVTELRALVVSETGMTIEEGDYLVQINNQPFPDSIDDPDKIGVLFEEQPRPFVCTFWRRKKNQEAVLEKIKQAAEQARKQQLTEKIVRSIGSRKLNEIGGWYCHRFCCS